MNTCDNCRWVMSDILVLKNRTCEKHWEIHPIYGKIYLSCECVRKAKEFHNTLNHCNEWEQGGLKGWFQRLKKKFYD